MIVLLVLLSLASLSLSYLLQNNNNVILKRTTLFKIKVNSDIGNFDCSSSSSNSGRSSSSGSSSASSNSVSSSSASSSASSNSVCSGSSNSFSSSSSSSSSGGGITIQSKYINSRNIISQQLLALLPLIPLKSVADTSSTDTVVIPLEKYDGLYLLNFTVSGNTFRGIVDTGSPFVLVPSICSRLWGCEEQKGFLNHLFTKQLLLLPSFRVICRNRFSRHSRNIRRTRI